METILVITKFEKTKLKCDVAPQFWMNRWRNRCCLEEDASIKNWTSEILKDREQSPEGLQEDEVLKMSFL